MAHKFDYSQKLLDTDGKPFTETKGQCPACGHVSDGKELTLKDVLGKALSTPFQDDKPEDRFAKGCAAIKVAAGEGLESEEITFAKKAVGKLGYNCVLVVRVWNILENNDDEKKK